MCLLQGKHMLRKLARMMARYSGMHGLGMLDINCCRLLKNNLIDRVPLLKPSQPGVICFGCQYGKSHRLPFPKSASKSSSMFQLVHSDLMGPNKTLSYGGSQYMTLMVDFS